MASSLDSLIQRSSEMTILLDEQSDVQFASGSAARLFGFDPVSLVMQPVANFVDPPDREPLAEALVLAQSSGAETSVPVAVLRPDGIRHECEISVRPLVERGRPTGWLLSSSDVSTAEAVARLRSCDEAAFEHAASCSPFVIFRLNAKGSCTYLNERWTTLTGQPMESALGRGWLSVIDDADRKAFRAITGAAHLAGKGWCHTFRVRRTDGSVRWVEGAAEPLGGSSETERPAVGVLVDVSSEIALQRTATESN